MESIAKVVTFGGRGTKGLPDRYRIIYADGTTTETDRHVENPLWHAVLDWIVAGGVPTAWTADHAADG